jgi:hypothetical protein
MKKRAIRKGAEQLADAFLNELRVLGIEDDPETLVLAGLLRIQVERILEGAARAQTSPGKGPAGDDCRSADEASLAFDGTEHVVEVPPPPLAGAAY